MTDSATAGVVGFLDGVEGEIKRDASERLAAKDESMELKMKSVPIRATRKARLRVSRSIMFLGLERCKNMIPLKLFQVS
jgi:hypothetical protein